MSKSGLDNTLALVVLLHQCETYLCTRPEDDDVVKMDKAEGTDRLRTSGSLEGCNITSFWCVPSSCLPSTAAHLNEYS